MSHFAFPWLRRLRCTLVLLPVTAVCGKNSTGASSPADPAAQGARPPVVAPSLWDFSNSLRVSIGWRDNVTVSAVNSISRAFYRGEIESFVIRPIGHSFHFISFFDGDVLRYVNPPPGISGEQQWAGALEGRWQPVPVVRTTLKGVGFIENTFIDPSETEGSQQPATWVRFRGWYAPVSARVKLPGGFAVEPSVQVKQIRFQRGYAGDYDETRPGLSLEWKHTDRFVLSATYYDHARHYSRLNANASGGRVLKDRRLALTQREGELKASSGINRHGAWTASLTLARLENRDRAYGYLDYNQNRIGVDIGWSGAKWRVSGSADARRLDYLHQTVGFGPAPARRIADLYEFDGKIEYDLTQKWTVFASENWERNRSNIHLNLYRFSYRTDTMAVGLQRTF